MSTRHTTTTAVSQAHRQRRVQAEARQREADGDDDGVRARVAKAERLGAEGNSQGGGRGAAAARGHHSPCLVLRLGRLSTRRQRALAAGERGAARRGSQEGCNHTSLAPSVHTRADAAAPGAGRLAVSAWQRALRRQEHFRGGAGSALLTRWQLGPSRRRRRTFRRPVRHPWPSPCPLSACPPWRPLAAWRPQASALLLAAALLCAHTPAPPRLVRTPPARGAALPVHRAALGGRLGASCEARFATSEAGWEGVSPGCARLHGSSYVPPPACHGRVPGRRVVPTVWCPSTR